VISWYQWNIWDHGINEICDIMV